MKNLLLVLCLFSFCLFNIQCQQEKIPTGIFPDDGTVLSEEEANKLVFSWNPVEFRDGRNFSYRIRVFEADSIASKGEDSQYYFKNIMDNEIKTTYFRYSSQLPKLQQGKLYAWEVKTIDTSGLEATIKNPTSFSLRKINKDVSVPDLPCKIWFKTMPKCSLSFKTIPCPLLVHMATGGFLSITSQEKSMVEAGMSQYDSNFNCFDVDTLDDKVHLSFKFTIVVPDSVFYMIGPDSVVFKVFENQIPLTDNEFSLENYTSLFNDNAVPFKLTPDDYERVCDDNNHLIRQAVVLFNVSFQMKYSLNLARPSIKNYETVFDLVPNNFHLDEGGTIHRHDTIPCPNSLVEGTYEYYKYMDLNENECHQGKHIVWTQISRFWCGYRDINIPVTVSPLSNTILSNTIFRFN